jgi:hypothetical protein
MLVIVKKIQIYSLSLITIFCLLLLNKVVQNTQVEVKQFELSAVSINELIKFEIPKQQVEKVEITSPVIIAKVSEKEKTQKKNSKRPKLKWEKVKTSNEILTNEPVKISTISMDQKIIIEDQVSETQAKNEIVEESTEEPIFMEYENKEKTIVEMKKEDNKVYEEENSEKISLYTINENTSTDALIADSGIQKENMTRSYEADAKLIRTLSVGKEITTLNKYNLISLIENKVSEGKSAKNINVNQNEDYKIESPEHLVTKFQINSKIEGQLEVPIFKNEFLQELGINENLKNHGHILIESEQKILSFDIDNRYLKAIYLDRNYKTSETPTERVFVVGVEPGLSIISIEDAMGARIHQFTQINNDQVNMAIMLDKKEKYRKIKYHEKGLVSNTEISLSELDIKMFLVEGKIQKLSPSVFLQQENNYYQLMHLKEPIYLSIHQNKNVVIPTEKFIENIMGKINPNFNKNSCLIQINLNGRLKEIKYQVESYNSSMVERVIYYTKRGEYFESLTDETDTVFLLAENQTGDYLGDKGTAHFSLFYDDGRKETFQSFCSPGTYLVEQL